MNIKLQFASLVTLGLLSGFVLAIVLAVAYFVGDISWQLMIGITIAFNFLLWLLGPYISDIIYKWFYKIKFYTYDEIKQYPFGQFIRTVCDNHKIPFPRIGIIKDLNPTAFTYGSAPFNARVVLTEGLFKFLNKDELEAVVAHELGHIVNRDFIIMAIATTLLQLLYEFYVIFARARTRSASFSNYRLDKKAEKKSGGGALILIGYISLLFYWIGTYIVLYLSRLREYYADEFSAKVTGDPNLLSSALIKIAYGIASVPDTAKTAHLLNNTRAQGIFDFKTANEIGLAYQNSKGNTPLLQRVLLFDIVNPWAWIYQLKSTHPLVGKRIKRLSNLASVPAFDFSQIISKEVNKKRLWKNFFTDLIVAYSMSFSIIAFIIILALQFLYKINYYIPTLASFSILLIALLVIKIRYRFPLGRFQETDILSCMADIYASPIRGRPISLSGQAIGRGQAGFIFGEDMMFQDNTGIIYLNYESPVPIFGNLYFGWKKLEALLGKPATATGWFLRGSAHHIELLSFEAEDKKIKSYVRFWAVFGMFLNIILWGLLIGILAAAFGSLVQKL